ncbi:CP family cyanate transporter-like MFS transporter [Algoriphagus iocasae]|uniref:CP family cyanate transporter-like MFS transporter n=1 Tax=Algoriphagus iocasae TaxID=1836499 RepID=A0A841MMT5_9BACT|nr:MFS transporter [Algoriphagus iocasae]MBB6326104.1 CP family cyanate transporter-like MFS transporter [Algoriphagus iocasae]
MSKALPSQSLLITGILLISINLRTSIASVGPLIPFIREDLGLSNGLAGFLTTLPLLTFATFSLFAPAIGKKLGMGRAVFLGILILTIGVVLRVLGGIELLLFGTALTGIGIVIANVLLIPLIKVRLPQKLGLMTALLATMMSLFAAIAAGFSVPIAVDLNFGWRGSLSSWAIFMVIALFFWIPQLTRPKAGMSTSLAKAKNVWKSKLAWQITIFMGCQSVMYFTLTAWLPDMLIARGWSPVEAGAVSSIMQLISLVGSYFAPSILIRLKEQSGVILGVGIGYIIGFLGLFLESEIMTYLSLTVIGLGMGASLSIAYTLISLRTAEDQTTAKLSAMVQSSGYYLAALGPILFGVSLDLFGSWNILIWFLIFFSVLFTGFGMAAGRDLKI